jgi:manganese transport protein
MISKLKNMGPGILVAAAFIGPGTVTACTVAGASFGYALLWALVFATVSTMILQEMAARLGTISQEGLGEVLAKQFKDSKLKIPMFVLITVAIFVGNAAYEGGNLTGAALGVQAIFGNSENIFSLFIIGLAAVSMLVLYKGNYKQIEKVLIILVCLMGSAFILTFFVVQPSLLNMLKGAFIPSMPEGSLLTVLALIGTTIVPYNLFLHASAAKQKYVGEADLKAAQFDTVLSIGIGGLVAIFIVSTSAASLFAAGLEVKNAADMAVQLKPLFGDFSQWLIGIGLISAGLSSAITAPLATGYAISGLLNVSEKQRTILTKRIALLVAVVGTLFALTGINPIEMILMAQFANGLLLPIIACFLLYVMNNKAILGRHTNGVISNALGGAVVLFTLLLGGRLIVLSMGAL